MFFILLFFTGIYFKVLYLEISSLYSVSYYNRLTRRYISYRDKLYSCAKYVVNVVIFCNLNGKTIHDRADYSCYQLIPTNCRVLYCAKEIMLIYFLIG